MTDTELKRRKAICEAAHVDEIDDVSDGFHTFRQLYYQRMMLFATIVKQNKDKAWKSLRHEDGELCFGGEWFIVGVDTPEGSYTYHYENNYFGLFDCEELERGKHWDGHTEKDVTRLLSLSPAQPETHEERTETHACDLIDRQTAIDAILAVTGNSSVRELYEHVQEHGLSEMWSGGVNAAIDIIIAVPSVQTESKETSSTHKALDTISRQAAIDSMCELMRHWFGCDSKDEIREIKRELGKLPSAQPERPKGQWTYICNSDVNGLKIVECSKCHKRAYGSGNYCHNCGAEMVKGWE